MHACLRHSVGALIVLLLYPVLVILYITPANIPIVPIVLLTLPLFYTSLYHKPKVNRGNMLLAALGMLLLGLRYADHPGIGWTIPLAIATMVTAAELMNRAVYSKWRMHVVLALAWQLPAESPDPQFRIDADCRSDYMNDAGRQHLAVLGAAAKVGTPDVWTEPLQRALSTKQVVHHT